MRSKSEVIHLKAPRPHLTLSVYEHVVCVLTQGKKTKKQKKKGKKKKAFFIMLVHTDADTRSSANINCMSCTV